MSTGPDISLNSGVFEMERMLRQNAHEKAFELQVLAQRAFEQEKSRIVFEGRQQIKTDIDEKMKKLNQDMNIERSQKINESRLIKMKERNLCLLEVKALMAERLKLVMKNERSRYLATVKNLILQSMIKLLEPTLQVKCRKEDVKDIQGMVSDLQSQYSKFMLNETGREYECNLEVLTDNFMTDAQDKGCGGVMLYTENNRIVVSNTLNARLDLAFEEMLPLIRQSLFPGRDE